MRVRRSLLFGATASYALCPPPIAAFAPAPHVGGGGLRVQSADGTTMTALRSTVEDEKRVIGAFDSSWNIGAMPNDEDAKKREVAKLALSKLLVRQRRELQQTMDLIENLNFDDNGFGTEPPENTMRNGTLTTEAHNRLLEAPTIASSIAAGADYGFLSRSEGCRFEAIDQMYLSDERFEGYGPPGNVWSLGSQQFMRNCRAMFNEYRDEDDNPELTPRQRELQTRIEPLTVNSTAIWERERSRGEVVAPWIIKVPYFALCYTLDVVFEGRNAFGRFFLLETVARMPYFTYISMLHLYETLGFWRRSSDVKRIHFAEEWNEYHHLLIMESLGGDQPYWVRFLAQHSAIAYYVALSLLWMASPTLSYKFSEMLETHAVDTYGQFLDENEDALKDLPPTLAAVQYYTVGVSDPMFGEYQTSSVASPLEENEGKTEGGIRKPGMNMHSLYDVFAAILADEGDHVSTMKSCLDPTEPVLSPALESRALTGVALAASMGYIFGTAGGFTSLSETLASTVAPDALDTVIAGSMSGADSASDGIFGAIAGFFNGAQSTVAGEGVGGVEDTTGVEEIGGLAEGFELEAILDIIKGAVIAILEILGAIFL